MQSCELENARETSAGVSLKRIGAIAAMMMTIADTLATVREGFRAAAVVTMIEGMQGVEKTMMAEVGTATGAATRRQRAGAGNPAAARATTMTTMMVVATGAGRTTMTIAAVRDIGTMATRMA
jgi:hypothetical protein